MHAAGDVVTRSTILHLYQNWQAACLARDMKITSFSAAPLFLLFACSGSAAEPEAAEDTGALESGAVEFLSASCIGSSSSTFVVKRDRSCFYTCDVTLADRSTTSVRTLNLASYASTQKGELDARPCLGEHVFRATPKVDDASDRAEFTRTKFTITAKGAITYAGAMPLEVAPGKRETFTRPASDTSLATAIQKRLQPVPTYVPED